MQVVIEKLQAGARKAQEVARKIETPQATAQAAEDLVSVMPACAGKKMLVALLCVMLEPAASAFAVSAGLPLPCCQYPAASAVLPLLCC